MATSGMEFSVRMDSIAIIVVSIVPACGTVFQVRTAPAGAEYPSYVMCVCPHVNTVSVNIVTNPAVFFIDISVSYLLNGSVIRPACGAPCRVARMAGIRTRDRPGFAQHTLPRFRFAFVSTNIGAPG